jgi:hypothetical protein
MGMGLLDSPKRHIDKSGGLLGGLFGSQPATSGFSYGQYGTGIDPSTGEYFGSLYF